MNLDVFCKHFFGNRPAGVSAEKFGLRSCDFTEYGCRCEMSKKKIPDGSSFSARFSFFRTVGVPLAVGLRMAVSGWKKENYLFLPAAVYNGNRFLSKPLPYPPYDQRSRDEAFSLPPVVTDIPHLSRTGQISKIQLRSGDLSTPAAGWYDREEKKGVFLFFPHHCGKDYTGISVEEDLRAGTLTLSVSSPAVREENCYFFGERADGSGFYPDSHTPSCDTGRCFEAGDEVRLSLHIYEFPAETLDDFFAFFHRARGCLEHGNLPDVVPFSQAYRAVKEKYQRANYLPEGYYSVGTNHGNPLNCWQAGWVGGGMNSYPFLLEDSGEARRRAVSTYRFILDRLQLPSGWIAGVYADGVFYGDNFDGEHPGSCLLLRKNADLLYFLIRQAMLLDRLGLSEETRRPKLRRLADAFVRLFEKYGQLGQFIDTETDEILVGNSASAAIACAALALASSYFSDPKYLETAEALGDLYDREYVSQGLLNGGPGEICQAPDSESAFGMVEGYVQLYETTRKERWLHCAEKTFRIAETWVVSYDFHFPPDSVAARRGVHTLGTVFANAQNKHSAPGICTLSGSSLLKLYRFTGDRSYLERLREIAHAIGQFVSLEQRRVMTLEKRWLPDGCINERVQMSDWEGKETVGEFLCGSNWPEVSMLLTYTEIPGVYVDFAHGFAFAFDHIVCETEAVSEEEMTLRLRNTTDFDAKVTLLADDTRRPELLTHNDYPRMQTAAIPAGGETMVQLRRPAL